MDVEGALLACSRVLTPTVAAFQNGFGAAFGFVVLSTCCATLQQTLHLQLADTWPKQLHLKHLKGLGI